MIKPKELAIALVVAANSMVVSPALAVNDTPTYQGSSIYKDSLGNIYVAPGSSNVNVNITVSGATLTKGYNADRCGVITFKFPAGVTPPTSVLIDSVAADLTTSTTIASKGWFCDKTSGVNVAKTSDAVLPNTTNPIVNVGNLYYFYRIPSAQHLMQYTGDTIKNVRINSCGFGKIPYTAAQNLPNTATIVVTNSSFTPTTIAQLVTAPGVPICKSGTLLLPAGWLSGE